MTPHNFHQTRSHRIGLFGGTFNPIHLGHLQVALDVQQQLELDEVYFIPSSLPPHKGADQLAAARDRLEMVRLALGDRAGLAPCGLELEREGPSYSIDTIRHIRRKLPDAQQLYFMMGLDAFLEIHTWKAFRRLFEETAIAVMSRPGSGQWTARRDQEALSYVQRHIAPEYRLKRDDRMLVHPDKQCVYLLSVTPVDISSSSIRSGIQKGEPLDRWVAPPVARYIQQKGLYR